jgi:hypothetical protein
LSSDVDSDSVIGSRNSSGKYPRGLLWSMTTKGERLMPAPIAEVEFQKILNRCFFPFHAKASKNLLNTFVPRRRAGPRTHFTIWIYIRCLVLGRANTAIQANGAQIL